MNLYLLLLFLSLFIIHVDPRRHSDDTNTKSRSSKDYSEDLYDNEVESAKSSSPEKKYPSRKKPSDDFEEPDKPPRRPHSSKTNSSKISKANPPSTPATTTESYAEEASLCINEFDMKREQLVKVKDLKNGAYMIRFVRIEEPSAAHGLDIKDICMLNCCVEKNCDLAMLSEQRTNDGYKCYLFACNGSCTYAAHQDYTSMILKRDLLSDDEPSSSSKPSGKNKNKNNNNNEKSTDASSSVLSTTCRSTEFSCRDGSCIPYYDVCNSYEDCPSGIDEEMCTQEFALHQRTQQENRKKPAVDIDSETNAELEEVLDDAEDEEASTKSSNAKSPPSKSKSKNREGTKQNSSFLYNIDLETQDRVSRLQQLKEHLEETKGPEAWYHLFQTLIQHQHQDHANVEPESTSLSSSNDDENFKDHLLALEQQWIADRQKTSSTTSTTAPRTTMKSRGNVRKTTKSTTTTRTTTTKRMKIVNEEETRGRRPPPVSSLVEDELADEEEEEDTGSEDTERYYYQPAYDDRRGNRYGSQQKSKSTTTTRKSKTSHLSKENSITTLERASPVQSDAYSHAGSLLRESTVILIFLLGLVFTIILLVLVGFYCRDSWKRGRVSKHRSTDADYLINGLYL